MPSSCWRGIILGAFVLAATGCPAPTSLELRRGIQREQSQDYNRAMVHFSRVITRSEDREKRIKAAKRGAKIAHFEIKDFDRAIEFYEEIIRSSKDSQERVKAQKEIARIVYENKNDYRAGADEINKLLSLNLEPNEENEFRLLLARCYFYIKDLFQAEVEAKEVLKKTKEREQEFEAKLLIGNILQAQQKSDQAIALFEKLVKEYPQLSQKQNVGFNLALTFEDQSEFDKAIRILKSIRDEYSTPEYIDLKIKRLKERAKNLPAAQGYRK